MSEFSHADYFPDESFPDDPEESELLSSQSYWRNHYTLVKQLHAARLEMLGSDRYLTIEEEHELAGLIQAGLQAREKANVLGEKYDGRYDHDIESGVNARTKLVIVNLPFAAYFARASVGKVPKDTDDISLPAQPGDAKSYIGTYANVRNLANPRADIDDRTQTAMEAMWVASEKFIPLNNNAVNSKKASFGTFAAWPIQSALQRSSASEVGGWYLADHTLQQYRDAIKHLGVYGILPAISHQGADGNKWASFHPDVVYEGRKGVAYEEAGQWTAPEEEHPSHEEEVAKLTLAEVVPANGGDIYGIDNEVALLVLSHMLDEMLWEMPVRQGTIIRMRYGLDDEEITTLKDIGEYLGITPKRVRQIEHHTMSILRHPKYSDKIRSFLGYSDNHWLSSFIISNTDGAVHLKTRRIEAVQCLTNSEDEEETNPESEINQGSEIKLPWQVAPDDNWDEDIRPIALHSPH